MDEFTPVLLTLPALTPSLALEILPYGLTIHRIYVQADGRTHDLVIGPETAKDHISKKYINTVIGRYANRVPVGTNIIERNGIRGKFTPVANENPRVSLHGGPTGFDSLPWTAISKPTLFSNSELAHLIPNSGSHAVFRLVSPDGDQGYPSQLVVEALVALVAPGEQERKYKTPGEDTANVEYDLGSIVLVYRAKLEVEDGKKAVTPINLTQHWGFNLDASLQRGPESLSVKNHRLTIKADRIVDRDKDSLSTGSFTSTANDMTHTHDGKPIGENFPECGYDDFYVFNTPTASVPPTRILASSFIPQLDLLGDILRSSTREEVMVTPQMNSNGSKPVVELTSEKSGLTLAFRTNQSGVMFYSNNAANVTTGSRKKIHGGSGAKADGYGPGTAAFLEFHEPLASFLNPTNKDGADTLLTSDEIYHYYVRVDIKYKEPRCGREA